MSLSIPSLQSVPESFFRDDNRNLWCKIAHEISKNGLDGVLLPKEGVQWYEAWQLVKCITDNNDIPTKQRFALSAYTLSLYFDSYKENV